MTLTQTDKDALNIELHTIRSQVDSPPDYLESKAALQPVLDALALDGWFVEAWSTVEEYTKRKALNPNVLAWETTSIGGVLRMRRRFRVTVTRTPEHQALVEARREVAKGDNTYSKSVGESRMAVVGGALPRFEKRTTSNAIETVAGMLKATQDWGKRPEGWKEI